MNAPTYNLSLVSNSFPLKAIVSFPKDFLAFQGHFPNNPILPAFMHVQAALDVLRAADLPHTLKEITIGKFMRPILPELPVNILITKTTSPETYDVTLQSESQTHSTFTLTVK